MSLQLKVNEMQHKLCISQTLISLILYNLIQMIAERINLKIVILQRFPQRHPSVLFHYFIQIRHFTRGGQ